MSTTVLPAADMGTRRVATLAGWLDRRRSRRLPAFPTHCEPSVARLRSEVAASFFLSPTRL